VALTCIRLLRHCRHTKGGVDSATLSAQTLSQKGPSHPRRGVNDAKEGAKKDSHRSSCGRWIPHCPRLVEGWLDRHLPQPRLADSSLYRPTIAWTAIRAVQRHGPSSLEASAKSVWKALRETISLTASLAAVVTLFARTPIVEWDPFPPRQPAPATTTSLPISSTSTSTTATTAAPPACKDKLRISKPRDETRVSGPKGVFVKGEACGLKNEFGWLFDYDPEDGFFYGTNPRPIASSDGPCSTTMFRLAILVTIARFTQLLLSSLPRRATQG
jgi:hypothetical protein